MDRFAKTSSYVAPPLIGVAVGLVFEFIIRPFLYQGGTETPHYVSIMIGLGLTIAIAGYTIAANLPPQENKSTIEAASQESARAPKANPDDETAGQAPP